MTNAPPSTLSHRILLMTFCWLELPGWQPGTFYSSCLPCCTLLRLNNNNYLQCYTPAKKNMSSQHCTVSQPYIVTILASGYIYTGERTNVNIRGGPKEVAVLCDMHSLMPVGFSRFLSMHDFWPGCLFAVVIECFMIEWMCDECAWHHKMFLVHLYRHLVIKLYKNRTPLLSHPVQSRSVSGAA